jgi:hypothetical protein
MITTDEELRTTLERIDWMQKQLAHLRKVELNPVNYRASAAGFLAEVDRMHLEVREFLATHPAELVSP